MRITDVTIRKVPNGGPCIGIATIVFDYCFSLRDVRLIDAGGRRLLAMPSRKATVRCASCGEKCSREACFCGKCGVKLPPPPASDLPAHVDIAHPMTRDMRDYLEKEVWLAYDHQGPRGENEQTKSSGSSARMPGIDTQPDTQHFQASGLPRLYAPGRFGERSGTPLKYRCG
jgi:DNA-binding cell septation regulator SpoVG